jgi:hypothetical protein
MMPPFYQPTYHSDISSVNDYSSSEEEDSCDHGDVVRDDLNPPVLRTHHTSDFYNYDVENFDPSSRQMRNNNISSSRPSKRPNNGDGMSSVTQEPVELTLLQPSHASNVVSNSTTHTVKGGLKLIGELHESKNEVFMNAILCEASREGFANTLCFPNRSKWLQTKVPIWFGSGGILGR